MILVDANLLLYAYHPRAEQHEKSRVWPDAVLDRNCHEHGATIYTTDRDFSRFSGIKWINPLVAAG